VLLGKKNTSNISQKYELPPKDGKNVKTYIFKGPQRVLTLDITCVSKLVASPAADGSMSVF